MRVLVVGGGFAGGLAAVRLAGRTRGRVDVTVVNPRADFVNRVRMHQVAVGRPVPSPSLPGLLGAGVGFVEGWVTALDPQAGRAEVSGPDGRRTVAFDRVILATGSTTERPPIPGGEHVHGVGDLAAARGLRPVLAALRDGSTVTVVGGGLTGLETVAELAESRPDLAVRLLTAGGVGDWFSPTGREYVRETLRRLGVETVDGVHVRAAEPGRLLLDDGAEVPSDLTVWCGGFSAPSLARESGIAVDEQGAVLTDAALRSVSHPSVLAVGDSGHAPGPNGGRYSMSCQFAFPSGAHAADVLRGEVLEIDGRPDDRVPFDLGFLGRCVSLGRRAAVLQLTDREDRAGGHAVLTGRSAVVVKRIQLAGMATAVPAERRMPGMVRWPRSRREAARDVTSVAG
jgi:NADH:ubiquinone reductase (H+-translocating)